MIGAQVCTQKWTRTQRFSYSYRRLSLWNTPISHLNLVCTENISKNNRGRLEQRKIDAKQVVHHSNTTNPDRCFKKYMLSTDATPPPQPQSTSQRKTLAYSPIQIPRTSITPFGHNTLNQTVKQLCKKLEYLDLKQITLCVLLAPTRLFQSGMQLILCHEQATEVYRVFAPTKGFMTTRDKQSLLY